MKSYIHTAEALTLPLARLFKFLEIFSQITRRLR